MYRIIPLLVSIAVVLAVGDVVQAQTEWLFEETDVFVGGQDDINTYRIPSLICTSKGTVLAFCEARRDSNVDGSPTHLVLKRSPGNTLAWNPPRRRGPVPEGRSRERNMMWQPMQVLIRCQGQEAFMNPVPLVDSRDGAIYLLVNHHLRYREGEQRDTEVWLLKSTDEGETWSVPKDLTQEVGPRELGPGVGIQLRSGRLVAPVYDGVIWSDDCGRNWNSGGKSRGPVSETQVVELVDGALMLNTRGSPNRTVSLSQDGGGNWGDPWRDHALTDSELWGGCQASLIRYTRKDDRYDRNRLLFASPSDPKHRFNLTVRISYDEGRTWPVAKLIKKGTGAYSSMTVFPDDTVGIIYETGNTYDEVVEYYSKLAFARFNLEWLTDGNDGVHRGR